MNGFKPNGAAPKWSGIEHVPRTLASCWHLLTKRLAELEMHGYEASERSRIRAAIDEALTALLAEHPGESRLVAIRWQGSRSGFNLSIDGQTVVGRAATEAGSVFN